MYGKLQKDLQDEIKNIEDAGLYKSERIITTPMGAEVKVSTGDDVIIMCSNNYLGLSSHPKVIEGAKKALDSHGFGMSSVRFICGTQDIHKKLEEKVSQFLGMEDTILYAASIIDGVRLCKAARYRYKNSDMADLEAQLIKAQDQRNRIIVTDGVFSMDGYVAKLDQICDLADKYDALVMVDDCHASGFIGKTGRGTHEHHNVMGRVDIITSTFGKALGGAMGGFTSGKKEIVEMLRQRSRPYLFSNSLSPAIVGATNEVLDLLENSTALRDTLEKNVAYFKAGIKKVGLEIRDGDSAIVPVMLYDAKLAQEFANKLLEEGVYAIGFFYPVVPKDLARIRVQLSAAHTKAHLDKAIAAFAKVGKELGVI
jgi:glycine C-acetyltransferase